MKFSIIVCVFNNEFMILDALHSIQSQIGVPVEIIVIDGGSTDSTVEKVRNSGINVDVLISEKDNGVYDAFNKGIRAASGDVIGFVHSDDFLSRNNILMEICLEFTRSGCDGVYGDLVYVSRCNVNKFVRFWKSESFVDQSLSKGWMPPHPTLFLKRHVFDTHGLFDTSLSISGDYDFCLRIFKDSSLSFRYYPEVITHMRTGGISNRSALALVTKMREDFVVIRRNRVGGFGTLILKSLRKWKQFLHLTSLARKN